MNIPNLLNWWLLPQYGLGGGLPATVVLGRLEIVLIFSKHWTQSRFTVQSNEVTGGDCNSRAGTSSANSSKCFIWNKDDQEPRVLNNSFEYAAQFNASCRKSAVLSEISKPQKSGTLDLLGQSTLIVTVLSTCVGRELKINGNSTVPQRAWESGICVGLQGCLIRK